jgi:hypothetical protein
MDMYCSRNKMVRNSIRLGMQQEQENEEQYQVRDVAGAGGSGTA